MNFSPTTTIIRWSEWNSLGGESLSKNIFFIVRVRETQAELCSVLMRDGSQFWNLHWDESEHNNKIINARYARVWFWGTIYNIEAYPWTMKRIKATLMEKFEWTEFFSLFFINNFPPFNKKQTPVPRKASSTPRQGWTFPLRLQSIFSSPLFACVTTKPNWIHVLSLFV